MPVDWKPGDWEARVCGSVIIPLPLGSPAPFSDAEFTKAASTSSSQSGTDMIINDSSLRTLAVAFNGAFSDAYDKAPSHYADIAMVTKSSTAEEEYGWLGLFPQLREWLGDRVIQSLSVQSFRLKNLDFELTVAVPRNKIQDDNIGIYAPMMREMGRSAGEHPDRMIFDLLKLGQTSLCYDGQFFFDTDHPVGGTGGKPVVSLSNFTAGDGPTWYLLDTSRAVRPFIYQERMPYNFTARDKPADDNVFFRKEYIYGVDGRSSAGFGLWQLAYASKAPLTSENYEAARVAMTAIRGDNGSPLGIVPDVLVVPTSLEGAGRRLLNTQLKSQSTTVDTANAGQIVVSSAGSNEWAGSAKLIATPYL